MIATARKTMIPFAMMSVIAFIIVLSAARHVEAPTIRQHRRNGTCEGTQIWFSPIRGTVMFLCGIPKTNDWGGIIWRITENSGATILSQTNAYECTAFIGSRQYWNNKIIEGGYLPLANFPDVHSAWRRYFK